MLNLDLPLPALVSLEDNLSLIVMWNELEQLGVDSSLCDTWGARPLRDALEHEIIARGLETQVSVWPTRRR